MYSSRFKVFLLTLFFLVLVSFAFLFSLGTITTKSLIGEILHKEEVVALAQAASISGFVTDFGESVSLLASLKSMESFDGGTQKDLDVFVRQWQGSGLVKGVLVTDSSGVVVFNSNYLGVKDVGTDLSDRRYFSWAKNQREEGRYFIDKPLVARTGVNKGKVIIPVASPILKDGEFKGVVVSSILIDTLKEKFMNVLKLSDKTVTYLIDSKGNLISGLSPEDVDKNIFEVYLPGAEGKINFFKSGSFVQRNQLVAYSPVDLEGDNWVVISVDYFDYDGFRMMVYLKLTLIVVLVFSAIFIFTVASRNCPPKSDEV